MPGSWPRVLHDRGFSNGKRAETYILPKIPAIETFT
jgi:hypothetical protein